MGFIADIEARTQSERAAILAHQFVTGVGDGTLPVEKFKHYVTQDYVYLIDYSRALALASLLPCQWGYWEIADHLRRQGLPQNAPLYTKWIEMYTSDEFSALAHHIREMADRIGDESNPAELTAMCQAYQTSVRLEHRFWDMASSLEGWKS